MQSTFNETKERAEQDGTEYQLGAIAVDLALVPKELRLRYAPDGVLQFNSIFDTNGCASRAPLNILEAKLNYFYNNGMHQDIKNWLNHNGYRVNDKIVLSDAFIEILSGTTPTGNSLKAPIDAIHRYGVIPGTMLPLEEGMTRDEYMNPSRIKNAHKELGKEFLRRIGIGYEQVPASSFLEFLKKDYLDAAGHGWPEPKDGVYPRTDAQIQHAFALVQDAIDALDNYIPTTKRLAKDYKFFDWGYTLSITRQTPFPDETIGIFETLKKHGLLAFFATALDNFLNAMTNSKPESVTEAPKPTVPVTVPPAPEKPKYDWSTPTAARHSVRVICDEEGLTVDLKNTLTACVQQESQFKNSAIGRNIKNGKVLSTDWGICQVNDYYHCGPGKTFPSAAYVVANPDAAVRWMARMFKAGQAKLWVSYTSGAYKKYL